jgi:hypothetical protein
VGVRLALVGVIIALAIAAAGSMAAAPSGAPPTAAPDGSSRSATRSDRGRPAAQFGGTVVDRDIVTNDIWTWAGSPYRVTTAITVHQGATLLVEPGVTVLFEQGAGLTINGRLRADGQRFDEIVFTGTEEREGWWSGVEIVGARGVASLGSTISEAIIAYGGESRANLYVFNGDVAVTHTAFVGSAFDGVRLDAGSSATTISYSNFDGNFSLAVRNAAQNPVFQAPNNYWGSPSGPRHASNPGATGWPVGDNVAFSPWLANLPQFVVAPASQAISPSGGTLEAGPLKVVVPPGAIAGTTTFGADPLRRPLTQPGLALLGAFTLEANGGATTRFSSDLTLEIAYDDAWLNGADPNSLGLYYRSGTTLVPLACRVDVGQHLLRCSTDHLTEFEFASGEIATPTPRPVPVPTLCPGCARDYMPIALRNQAEGARR